tara:strand:- start:867 stop:1052 length:186 start_codon:yes stop_codon:yes gene_type:complete
MANMSYCRFENTANDLEDCVAALVRGETENLSSYELNGLTRILEMAEDIMQMEEEIKRIIY